jgi:galactokinase
MLGGGDKGAAGAIVKAESVEVLLQAVDTAYPRSHPDFADNYAVHAFSLVEGIRIFNGVL